MYKFNSPHCSRISHHSSWHAILEQRRPITFVVCLLWFWNNSMNVKDCVDNTLLDIPLSPDKRPSPLLSNFVEVELWYTYHTIMRHFNWLKQVPFPIVFLQGLKSPFLWANPSCSPNLTPSTTKNQITSLVKKYGDSYIRSYQLTMWQNQKTKTDKINRRTYISIA